jgi:Tfp pilus assembly protein PilN
VPSRYNINLVREVRQQEEKAQRLRFNVFALSAVFFGVLGLAVLYAVFDVLAMNLKLAEEKQTLARVEAEYHKYKETRMTIDKADIELLDQIQHGRIFWTKKLAAMAYYLPENYWITSFAYDRTTFDVKGYGYISPYQEQLITIDDYLNSLRGDTTYNDALAPTYMNSAARSDEEGRERVSFEYSSLKKGAVAR